MTNSVSSTDTFGMVVAESYSQHVLYVLLWNKHTLQDFACDHAEHHWQSLTKKTVPSQYKMISNSHMKSIRWYSYNFSS